MRAVRYTQDGGAARIGRLEDDHVVDAGPAAATGFDASPEAWAQIANASGAPVALTAVSLLHPVVPRKLIGIGLNYRDHAAESQLAIPEVPVVFAKFGSAITSPGATIVVPREETRPDYEGEVGVVIGRRTYRADAAAARAAVGGLTAVNDVSGRRAQFDTPLRQFTLGKSFDTFSPMGPCVGAADGVDLETVRLRTTVSGEMLQESTTANLIFSIVELIVYCSAGMTLEPGDVIATGTPGGVGDSRTPPRYLRDGDVCEVWVEGVGTLRNPVAFEP
jgi:2-keto-4-pentenoate hydratase/2-oxohepta-3-ene-1,7-dioic acid hydratase in catechol pathway